LKEIFQPEFIGRIHSFIEFEELSKDDCIQIIDVQVNKFNEYLLKYYAESHIQFELSPSVYEYVLKK
jgi:ATP-dependent Clp protease ATP-binding subunit ClpA